MNAEQLTEFAQDIVDQLVSDGSDPDALYTIEHHFSHEDFTQLEKAAIAAFKQGRDVTEAEQAETEDGALVYAFDIVTEQPLDEDELLAESLAMLAFAQEQQIHYDGWGTFFEDPDGNADDDDEQEE